MAYDITFQQHSDFIHAMVSGDNSQETVVQYMRDVQDECKNQDCYRVLIEENLKGPRLDTMEVFDMLTQGSREALGFFETLAYVDSEMGDMSMFAETVAVNRGVPIAMFASVDEAREWLVQEKSNTDHKSVFLPRDL